MKAKKNHPDYQIFNTAENIPVKKPIQTEKDQKNIGQFIIGNIAFTLSLLFFILLQVKLLAREHLAKLRLVHTF